ncbi:MAG: DNA-3-methyladenine glycosylase 2 family protein [Ginsengibacter sp.]
MSGIVNKKDIKYLVSRNELFGSIHEKYGAPPGWTRPPGFISLCKIILEQQVSLASANAHFLKLNNYIKEFTPAEILKLTDLEMRTCQVSRQKSTYLRSLSNAVIKGNINLEELPRLQQSEARKKLTGMKGIGDWTADIYFLFCLQEKDIFPIGDIAIINTIKELSNVYSKEEIIRLAETWKPLRSLATYFLWHYYLKKRNRNPP